MLNIQCSLGSVALGRLGDFVSSLGIALVQDIASDASGALVEDVTADAGWLSGALITSQQTLDAYVSGVGAIEVTLNTDGSLVESDDWSAALSGLVLGGTYYASIGGVTLTHGGEEITARLTFAVVPVFRATIQAEDMTIFSGTVGSFAGTSGVGAVDGKVDVQTVAIDDLPSGSYDLTVGYWDENDGDAVAYIFVDDQQVHEWTWGEATGQEFANDDSKRDETITLDFVSGQKIRIVSYKNGAEEARVDYITLTSQGVSANVSPVARAMPELPMSVAAATRGAYENTASPQIIRVTTKTDTGEGSLRAALGAAGPRVIVFDVGGSLNLEDEISFSDEVTIMGETAPAPGITITGSRLNPRGDDVIITGLHMCPNDTLPGQNVDSRDGITSGDGERHVIAYNALRGTPDEIGGAYCTGAGLHGALWWKNLLAEAFVSPGHSDNPGEQHAFGLYFASDATASAPNTDIDLIGNIMVTMYNRVPAIRDCASVRIINNLFANWVNASLEVYDNEITFTGSDFTIEGNLFEAGPIVSSAGNATRRMLLSTTDSKAYYIQGNKDETGADVDSPYSGSGAVVALRSLHGIAPSHQAGDLRAHLIETCGPQLGDANDLRIFDYLQDMTTAPDTISETAFGYGGTAVISEPVARADSNSDGIYDAFETALGVTVGSLNPHDLVSTLGAGNYPAAYGNYTLIEYQRDSIAGRTELVITDTAPPVAVGSLAAISFVEDVAISAIDVALDFTGDGITYALAPSSDPLPAGLSLSVGGEITGTPTTPTSEVNIVVRGTNAVGYADTAFGLTVTVASSFSPASWIEVPGVEGGAVPIFGVDDNSEIEVTGIVAPRDAEADLNENDTDSGPYQFMPGGIEGTVGEGSIIRFTMPTFLTKDIDNLVINGEWYLGGVATGTTFSIERDDVEDMSYTVPSYTRPSTDPAPQIEVRGSATDSNGTRAFSTVIAETTVINDTPPAAVSDAYGILSEAELDLDLLKTSSGSITYAAVVQGPGTLTDITSSGGTFNAPEVVSGSEVSVIEFTITTTGGQTDDGEIWIATNAAVPTFSGAGTLEMENFFIDGWITVVSDAARSGGAYIQGQELPEDTFGTAYIEYDGSGDDLDLAFSYQKKTVGVGEIYIERVNASDDSVDQLWYDEGPHDATEWATVELSDVTFATGDILQVRSRAEDKSWGKLDSSVVAISVSESYPDFGEVVQSDENVNGAGAIFGSTPTTGNLILLSTIEDSGGAVTLPSGYVQIANEANTTDSGGLDPRMVTAYKVSDGTETSNQAIGMAGTGKRSHILAELDISGGGTLSQVQTISDDGDGSVTVAVDTGDTDRAIAFVAVGYARESLITAYTATAGWTLVEGSVSNSNNAPAVLLFSKELPSGGASSFTFTATAGFETDRGTIATAWTIRGV